MPPMSQTPSPFRVQTFFGTQVYLDPRSGRLRHGPTGSNPDNVRAQTDDTQLVFWHNAGTAGFRRLRFQPAPDGGLLDTAADQDGSEVILGELHVFDIEMAGPLVSIRHHGTYLSSELDGRMVLNRTSVSSCERFTLIEVKPAPPAALAPDQQAHSPFPNAHDQEDGVIATPLASAGGSNGIMSFEAIEFEQSLDAIADEPLSLEIDSEEPIAQRLQSSYATAAIPASEIEKGADTTGDESPVFHVEPQGLLANRMIQYMVALKFQSLVPGCLISNVSLPEWGIDHPKIHSHGPVMAAAERHHIDLDGLSAAMLRREVRRIDFTGYGQRLENFLEVDYYRNVFKVRTDDHIGYGREYLVCHVRAGEILYGAFPEYPLTPVEFYADLERLTGLQLVFVGQTSSNAYTDRLRARFPTAIFRDPQDRVIDFEMIRHSKNIVVGVSTFAWLAAWLSEADNIFMTVNGLFSPMHYPQAMLLPFDDARYHFYLFPINYAVLLEIHPAVHERIAPYWRQMPTKLLQRQLDDAPRVRCTPELMMQYFDPVYYLEKYSGVAEVMGAGNYDGARLHYEHFGFKEERFPFRIDYYWYANNYPLAGLEVAQGDYLNFAHHYAAIGHARGYKPCP